MEASISIKALLVLGDLELDVEVVVEGDPLGELPISRITLNGEHLRLSQEHQELIAEELREQYSTGDVTV